MQSDSELSSDSDPDTPSSENGPMTDRVNKIVHPSEYASSSDESETSLTEDDEETDDVSSDNDDETPLADKYKNLKYKLADTRLKMKNLVENIEEYKNFLEKEKEDIQSAHNVKIAQVQEEREEAFKRVEESLQIQQHMEQQYQDMVRDFNSKLESLQEEKKARVKENVENLQTLIKELTYIEESNQTLNEQLDKEREDHLATKEQLKLNSELVAQLELKLQRQQQSAATSTTTTNSTTGNGDTEDLKKQLQLEKSRADQVTLMLTQIRQILFASGGPEFHGESTLLSKLQEEQDSHKLTKTSLEDEQKKRKQNEKTIEKLNKRIKDLIHTHSNTLREISLPAAPPAIEEPVVVVKSEKSSTSSSPNNTITSKSKKKESENLTLEEKIQRMFLCVDTDRVEELSKLLKKTRGLVVATDSTGRTVLHKAALNGSSLQMVKLLLENGIEPNYQDINGWNVLHCAAKCPIDNSDVFKYLLKKQDIRADMVNNDGNLPIHFYARSKVINTEVLNILIHKTTSINATNYIGETPLHCACLSSQESAIQLLLKNGANPNVQNSKGESPLHIASRVGNVKVIMSLLEHGGDPYLKGDEGTPIDVAAPIDSVKSLLTTPIQSTLSLKDRKKFLASSVPPLEPSQDTPRSRNSTIAQEPKLMITVLCPELSISVQVPLEINIQVKDALSAIRKKIPGKHPNFVLYSTSQKLPENKKLIEFPEVAETLQLYYQPKDNPLMQAKNRSSIVHPGKLSLANHTLSSPSLIRRFSLSMDSKLLAPNGDNRRSSADTLVASKGQQQQQQQQNKDEKKVKLAQRVIRRYLAKKRYKELLARSNNRKFTVADIYQSEYEHVRSLETMYQNWVTPIIESSVLPIQTKEELTELFHYYESIIKVTKNLVSGLKPFTLTWNHHALIGKLFLTLDPPLTVYSDYAKSFQALFPTIHEKAFSALLLKIPAMTEQIANSIDVWLDVPIVHMQRVKKQILQLHRDTNIEHKDFEYIGQLLILIDAIQSDCERAHKSRKNLEMLLQIESRFVGNHPFLKLPDRVFIREGPLQRNYRLTSRSRHVILFSDILLFTEPVSKSNGYKYLEQIELNGHYEVKEYNDKASKGFVLVSPSNKDPIILTASTVEEKQHWIKSLSQVIHELKEAIQIPKSSVSTSDIKVKMSSLLNSGALSTSPTGSPLMSPSPVPSKGLRFLNRTTSVVAPKKLPEKYQNATSVTQMVDVMHQDACYICLNKFGVTKRKYVCKTCNNAMCKSCTVKNDKLCKNCAQGKSRMLITTFSDLPDKIVCKICFYLDISQVPKILMTCKRMYKLGSNPQFWKKLHRITFSYSLGESRRLSSSNYVSDSNPTDWKSKCITQNNWEKGRYSVSTIKGHGSAISTLKFHGNIMISGSMDTTAKIWNLTSGECIATLKGHLSTVKYVDIIPDKNLLLSVSDSYLKIWNTSSAKLIHSLKLYSTDISAMHYDPDTNCVVTASEKTIKFLSLNDYEVTKTLTDKSKIYSAFMRKDMLITGTNNGIKLWDLSQDKQINSLKGHSDIVRCVAFDTNTIVSGSEDNTIKLYNQQKEYTLTGHKGKIQTLQFDKSKVVSGSTDGTIKIWSVRNKNCLYTLKQPEADSGWVRCLQYSENILLSGHGDSVIRMWDFTPK